MAHVWILRCGGNDRWHCPVVQRAAYDAGRQPGGAHSPGCTRRGSQQRVPAQRSGLDAQWQYGWRRRRRVRADGGVGFVPAGVHATQRAGTVTQQRPTPVLGLPSRWPRLPPQLRLSRRSGTAQRSAAAQHRQGWRLKNRARWPCWAAPAADWGSLAAAPKLPGSCPEGQP